MQSPSRPCAFCSTPFSGRRNKLYCSEHCRYEAFKTNKTTTESPTQLVMPKSLSFWEFRDWRKKQLLAQIQFLQQEIRDRKAELKIVEESEAAAPKT